MLILEEYTYNRAKPVFDESGLVKEVISGPAWRRLLEYHSAEGVDAFIISHERFPDEFYRSLRKGTLLVRYGVGYDSVPVALCRELGVLVANTPGTLDQSVAEHAITLIASIARHIQPHDTDMKAGVWNALMAEELSGKTLAIAGFGSIGRTLARIAKHGFGMRVIAFDVNEKVGESYPDLFDKFTTRFDDAVGEADYVSLHMNLNPATTGFINAERLKRFKKGAVLVNTARGGIVNEDDLFVALRDGPLSFAGLDVFVHEPYAPSGKYDLRKLPNALLSPHVASHTVAANRRMAESAIKSIMLYEAGRIAEIPLVPELRK